MAEIDIDKMLEQREQAGKTGKKKSGVNMNVIYGAAAAVVLGVIAFIVVTMMKPNAGLYFPVENTGLSLFNISGKSPERWEFLDKKEVINGETFAILNRTDTGNNYTVQEYYSYGKTGVIKAYISENFGDKKPYGMIMLPPKVKKGAKFKAADTAAGPIMGSVNEPELILTTAGEMEAVRVDYKGGRATDKSIWYAQGQGVIKTADRYKNETMDIISITK
ncbi:MAG: hypothetical protein CVV21_01940 [Candidatus Goldiibacteriota bacterium HGW-Goldbacteria-1]|jgi:hypothetical protein|nr:MAG: hypothetical protein CVV21_01940 [Candidatus Goldiibacteriota bacterium HGW-Goldbacteria-1]